MSRSPNGSSTSAWMPRATSRPSALSSRTSTKPLPGTSRKLRRTGRKVILASYTRGARERLSGLIEDHGLKAREAADSWQEALASRTSPRCSSFRSITASPRPTSPCSTEQDMLGDRLVRRRKKRKAAAAFLEELATLSPGDLVVHADHGIGRYEGLTQIPVSRGPHDCVALEYARATSFTFRSRISELLSRYGSESEASPSTAWAVKPGSAANRG